MSPDSALLEKLRHHSVAILGYGISGRAAARLLDHHGLSWQAFDARGGDRVATRFAPDSGQVVVVSPGFAANHPWVVHARRRGCLILPEIELAALLWGGALVAVTGTNGKSTLCALLAAAFERAGLRAVACGNFGEPLSAVACGDHGELDWAVCEVSSFQAEQLQRFAPRAVFWTNFATDHLDRHRSLRSYFLAKRHLALRGLPGSFYAGASVWNYAAHEALDLPVPGPCAHLHELDSWHLPPQGPFGLPAARESLAHALAWWRRLRLPEEALLAAARELSPLPHRLQLVTEIDGRTFWDDSKATNLHATLAAVRRFPHPPIWIGGGELKGLAPDALADALAPHIQAAFIIGLHPQPLRQAFAERGTPAVACASLATAVAEAFASSEPGDTLLLSPAASSLDQFPGFAARGEAFRAAAATLASRSTTTSTSLS